MLARAARTPTSALAVALVALATLAAAPALAQPIDPSTRSAARTLGEEAGKLFESGDYAGALEKYNLADQLVPAPTLGVRAARCLVKLGRLVEASERYLDVTRIKLDKSALPVQRKAQVEAIAERSAIAPIIPTLEVEITGPLGGGVTLAIDGKSIPPALIGQRRPIDPGDHAVEVKRGSTVVTKRVVVAKSEHSSLTVELPQLPVAAAASAPLPAAPREPWQKVAGRVGLAVGVAGIVIGASHGLLALRQQSSLGDRCPNRVCPPDAFGAADFYDLTRAVSSVGFIVGGVGAVVGVTLLLTAPKSAETAPAAHAFVGPSGAGFRGVF